MKNISKILKFKMLLVFTLFTLASNADVGEIESEPLPEIFSPLPELQEGLEVELTTAQLERILPWASNSASMLEDLLLSTEGLTKTLRLNALISGVKANVIQSSPRNNETLMRFVLNRGLRIVEIVDSLSQPNDPGVLDAKLRLIVQSIKMATRYYEDDLALIAKDKNHSTSSFGEFAVTYSNFLSDLSNSIMSAQAQFELEKLNLGFLQWDLYRDSLRQKVATSIRRIHNHLNTLKDVVPRSDQEAIMYIRQIKKVKEFALEKAHALNYQNNGSTNSESTISQEDYITSRRDLLNGKTPHRFQGKCIIYDSPTIHSYSIEGSIVYGTLPTMKKLCEKQAELAYGPVYRISFSKFKVFKYPYITHVSGECSVHAEKNGLNRSYAFGRLYAKNLEKLKALCDAMGETQINKEIISSVTSVRLSDVKEW